MASQPLAVITVSELSCTIPMNTSWSAESLKSPDSQLERMRGWPATLLNGTVVQTTDYFCIHSP